MPKMDSRKLGARAAGKPAELCVNVVTGNQGNYVALPGSNEEDGLVSVFHAAAGSLWVDITATATLSNGSISPGVDIDTDQMLVTWYKF